MVELTWVALRQQEGLPYSALVVDAGQEELGEHAILALAGEDKPVTVAAPVVVAFSVGTVDFLERTRLPGLHIHQPQVGIGLADREVTAAGDAIHQPAAIVGRTDKRKTLVVVGGTQQRVDCRGKTTCRSIETNGAETALHLLVLGRNVAGVGTTVIERTAIRRKRRENLQILGLEKRREQQLVGTRVQNHDVAERMVSLDTAVTAHKETLVDSIDGVGAVVARRMPVGIAASGLGAVGLGVEPLLVAVFLNQRASALAADLQRQLAGIGVVGGMTVEATSRHSGLLQDGGLVEGMQVALIDTDVAANLIAGRNAAVGQSVVVESVRTDKNGEIAVFLPDSIGLHADGERQPSTDILPGNGVPVVDIEIGPRASGVELTSTGTTHHDIHGVDRSVGSIEVQRGDTRRYRHTDVVGIDRRQLTDNDGILGARSAGCKTKQQRQELE